MFERHKRYTLVVGAIVSSEKYAYYSEPFAALHCVVPSSGLSNMGVPTVTLHNQCTTTFGGTSAAAPLMAGVVALMLQANPNMTYRDVMHVVAKSAIRNDAADPDWIVNGGGYHHNHNYGFGRIDAVQTVNVAKTWKNVPPLIPYQILQQIVNLPIPQNGVPVTAQYILSSAITFVEHVDLTLSVDHPMRGQVEVILISPAGTKSVLASEHSDRSPNINWRYGTVRNWGEDSNGIWKVQLRDAVVDGNQGSFKGFQIAVYGYSK